MADNTTLDPGTGGDTIASDDIGGVKYPRSKLVHGADGTNDGDVSTSNPLPVRLYAGTTALSTGAGAVGTGVLRFTLSSDDPAVVALQIMDDWDESDRCKVNPIAGQAGIQGGAGTVTALTTRVAIATDANAVDTELPAAAALADNTANPTVPGVGCFMMVFDGTTWDRWQGAVTVSGTVTVSVSGTVTVTGTVAATQSGTWTVQPGNTANTTPWLFSIHDGTTKATVRELGTNDALNVAIVDGSGNQITSFGDVDVTSVTPGTGASNLGKAEDAAHASADVGVMALAVRTDTPANRSGTDGDYEPLQMSAGRLWVDASGVTLTVASHAVTNAGTFAVQVDGAALTALQLIDDAVFTDDTTTFTAGTTKGLLTGGVVDDDSTDAADEGDLVAFRCTKERKQRVVAAIDSATMQSGNDEVTPKFAIIDAATSGDNTLVAAVASKKIRVLALFLVAAGAVTARFESGAGGTALTGQMSLAANGGFVLGYNPVGWFETGTNTLLNLELSGAVSVDGSLTYIEVD